MGIRAWLDKLRRRQDAAAIERAEEQAVETPEEEAATSGDVTGKAADRMSARAAHEPSMEDAIRLGDQPGDSPTSERP